MRRYWFFVPVAVAFMGLALGCGGSEKAETSAQEEPAATDAEFVSINTTGKLGCGHCTFEVINDCSLAFEATDGEVYLLEVGDRQEELMGKRYDEPMATISGRVTEVDGQKVIYTDSVELR